MFVMTGDGDGAATDADSGLSQGAAIGIGVGMAAVCIAVAVLLLWLVRAKTARRSRRGSRADADDVRDSKLALNGVYTCADCGSSFGSADEVVKHREERH
jgi:hypothetical protein